MARIGTDRMIVRGEYRPDHSWLFTICYTACFAEADLGQRFDDAVQIRQVHAVGPGAVYEQPVFFTATSRRVFRKKRIVVRSECFDPESGLDTVCAWIRLHSGARPVVDEQCTPPLVPQAGPAAARATRSCPRVPVQSLRC